jgi:hypothetical protein
MAVVSAGRFATIHLKDQGGNGTTRTFELVAVTDTQAQIDVASILIKLLAVTNAKLDTYSISEKFVENAFTLPTGAEVENQLQITVPIAGKPNKSGTISIPAPKDGVFVAASGEGYNQPDFTDSALIAYVDIFTATGNQSKISDGEVAVLTNAKGKRVHAKSNRG